MTVTTSDVRAAAERIGDAVRRTPLTPSRRLSEATGANVLLKREDLQPVRSYKIRGALNLVDQLTDSERAAGVVAASAGNHAQGVALACADRQVKARIYLPANTPRQKRDRVQALGGEWVELVVGGATYDDAAAAAAADAERTGATVVPAFDDERVVAGQGTVMREIIEDLDGPPDVVVVPVGGGGLLSGTLSALGDLAPRTRVVAVEPTGAASLVAAREAGEPVTLESVDSFADGTAVRRMGDVTFGIISGADVEVHTVDEGAICVEMLALYQTDGIIAEPSGAMASAALAQLQFEPDQTVVTILSGGNNDVSRYGEVVERALVHEGRKHYFLVEFPQQPGALRSFLDEVLGPDDDIALFEYLKRYGRDHGPALVGIELGDPADHEALLARMDASPLRIESIPPNSPLFRFVL